MKFIIHTQYYPPEIGAPQARLSELAQILRDHGHEVFILTAMPNYPRGSIYEGFGGLFKREIRDGISVIHTWIYPTKSVRLLPRLTNYFSFAISSLLCGMFTLPRADYLLTESPPLFLGISGFLLSRMKGARWIFNVSDLWPESAVYLGVIRKGLALRASESLEAFCYRKAWLVTGQSKEILTGIKRRLHNAVTFHLSNGVDCSRYRPDLASRKVHDDLGDGAECVALYGGLHGIAQGLDQILDAAESFRSLNEKLKIVLVGEGSEKVSLVKRAGGLKVVEFLDPKPRQEMPRLLASVDIAIVPLKMYIPGAVPSKLYEAMASGLPVVLIAEGEAVDILTEAQGGIVVSPGAIDELARALMRLALDPGLRKRLGENGRKAAVQLYDRQKIGTNFVRFIENRPNHSWVSC